LPQSIIYLKFHFSCPRNGYRRCESAEGRPEGTHRTPNSACTGPRGKPPWCRSEGPPHRTRPRGSTPHFGRRAPEWLTHSGDYSSFPSRASRSPLWETQQWAPQGVVQKAITKTWLARPPGRESLPQTTWGDDHSQQEPVFLLRARARAFCMNVRTCHPHARIREHVHAHEWVHACVRASTYAATRVLALLHCCSFLVSCLSPIDSISIPIESSLTKHGLNMPSHIQKSSICNGHRWKTA
jgi:hypothetical protein